MTAHRLRGPARHARCVTVLIAAGVLGATACSSSSNAGGTGGAGGGGGGQEQDAAADVAIDAGPVPCAGKAIALDSNVPTNGDPARSRVMVDFGGTATATDLPVGNAARTIELWAFVRTSSWRGDANTIFEYGQVVANGGFGLDFGTTPVGTLDPYTNGSFDNDNQPSGITDFATSDQWIHFAMTYDQTAVTLYVNGIQQARKTGTGMLATALTQLTIGGNPRGAYFNGQIDEFRVWNVARSQADIMATMNRTLTGAEAGLVGYFKFDDGDGTTARDSVTSSGHTAHDGVLMAATPAMNPVWVDSTAPIFCN